MGASSRKHDPTVAEGVVKRQHDNAQIEYRRKRLIAQLKMGETNQEDLVRTYNASPKTAMIHLMADLAVIGAVRAPVRRGDTQRDKRWMLPPKDES